MRMKPKLTVKELHSLLTKLMQEGKTDYIVVFDDSEYYHPLFGSWYNYAVTGYKVHEKTDTEPPVVELLNI